MTTQAKHTSGPWHVGTKEHHHCVYDSHGWWIADASPHGKDEDTKANARLIAAAPDMLAALERVAEIIASGEDLSNEAFFGTDQNWIRSAIAKAKGE